MVAVLINGLTICVGGIAGYFFSKRIKKEMAEALLKGVGLVVILLGILGIVKASIVIINDEIRIENNQIITRFDLLLVISIALGILAGELLKIDDHLKYFGNYLEKRINKGAFSEGFINASLVFCVGAMSIVGSIKAALGDPSILYFKAIIDGITAMIFASSLGFGVIFSFIPVILFQGALTGLGIAFGNFVPNDLITAFSLVGYAIVVAIGLNFLLENKIRVANMIPSLIFAIALYSFY